MHTIRCFVGVSLPSPLRAAISETLLVYGRHHADIKWVETENLHLTLKFIGKAEMTTVDAIKPALAQACRSLAAFEAALGTAGGFPTFDRASVLWAAVTRGSSELTNLAAAIESALESFGIEKESRPYRAHLTLGRVRTRKRLKPLVEELKSADFSNLGTFPVNTVTLFESQLTDEGPSYQPLERFPLGVTSPAGARTR